MIYNFFSPTGKKEIDYGTLWTKFVQTQNNPELKEWQKKVYMPGQYQGVKSKLSGSELQAEVISEELFNQ